MTEGAKVSDVENEFLKVYRGITELVQLTVEGVQTDKIDDLVKMIKESSLTIDTLLDSLSNEIPQNVSFDSLLASIMNKSESVQTYRTQLDKMNSELLEAKVENFSKLCKITDDFLSNS